VLVDGLGANDASNVSDDHAVAIEPLTADRIEVLRGPAVLIYGGSAIGGAVNVIDKRIPLRVPEETVHFDAQAAADTAYDLREGGASADVPLSGNLAFHVDGAYRHSDDVDIAGDQLSDAFRQQVLDEAAEVTDPAERAALVDAANNRGTLPNSATETWSLGSGLAWFGNGASLGASVGYYDTFYEVPTRPGPDAEEDVSIGLKQWRGDVRGSVDIGSGLFEQATTRWAYTDYKHTEFEGDEAGTTFLVDGIEGRVELVQREVGGWGGTSGIQYLDRNARIRGEEKFLPDSRQRQAGIFTEQSYVAGRLRVEGGIRVEFSRLTAEDDLQLGTPAQERKFTTVSGSLGGSYEVLPDWRLGLTASSSSRTPSIDELFANGPHGGSQAFEIGNPDLDPERSLSIEASLRRSSGPINVAANLYYSRFSNFIFQAPTGTVEDDLPVYAYRQGRANYYGFELQADGKFGEAFGIRWGGEASADAVRATIKNYGPAPQIPPLRLLAALTGERGPFDGRVEVEHALKQDRTAPLETPTPGYTLVNTSIDWHPLAAKPELTLSLAANNIFDVVARRHSSLLKDYAPLAGRDIRLTARIGF